jgi:hypothetical protein
MPRILSWRSVIVVLCLCLLAAVTPLWLSGQPLTPPSASAGGKRLTFDVVQSFDAKYEGDTPGHLGRAGGLQTVRPNVALGDPIYRGDEQVGKVTGLTWNRINGGLDIEFDPEVQTRIAVGDEVWMALDGRAVSGRVADKAK